MAKADKCKLVFSDISVELWREYRWCNGAVVRIDEPKALNVSASGGHRVEDYAGNGHYIAPGWIHLKWAVKSGDPVFVL